MNECDYGTATVTFARWGLTHDVVLRLQEKVTADDLDGGELAWEAAAEWPEADWHLDKPSWGVVKVTATIDGETTDITPREF
jgi:hypothetical protein